VLCFLNDMWVVPPCTTHHAATPKPATTPHKEESAVEEDGRGPARVGVVLQEEAKRKKDEESNGEPAREGGGEGAATIGIPSGEGANVPSPAAQETIATPPTTLTTSTEADNTQQPHPTTPTGDIKKLLLTSKFLNAATRTTTKRKRKAKSLRDGLTLNCLQSTCFNMPHSVKALSEESRIEGG